MSGHGSTALRKRLWIGSANELIRRVLFAGSRRSGANVQASSILSEEEACLSSYSVGQGAACPFAPAEFLHGAFEVGDREIRPALRQKDEFGKGALPQ
jgi:hypothetical protein